MAGDDLQGLVADGGVVRVKGKVSYRGVMLSAVVETVRYTYRLRPGATASAALLAEWGRCRWLWNEAVHQYRTGRRPTFGGLSRLLTEARSRSGWLREGSQVVQQQTLRTYALALQHSYKVKGRGRPRPKRRKDSLPSLEYTLRGFTIRDRRQAAKVAKRAARQNTHDARAWAKKVVDHHAVIAVEDFKPTFLARSRMARKAADAAIGAAKRELVDRGVRAGRKVVLVPPVYTTMTCSQCATRAKERLGLGVRAFRCDNCGYAACRDRNAARTILATVERDRAGVDDVRHAITSFRGVGSDAV